MGVVTDARAAAPTAEAIALVASPQDMALCARVCMLCVCVGTLDCTNTQLCFSNANLTRGLCVAATARPTSTTASCIGMPASLGPKSRWTTMDTAKVRHALSEAMGSQEGRAAWQGYPESFPP